MIKEIIIKDFFSFEGECSIRLNRGVNILVGINGSGKTSFINAFRLLYEGVCGDGFENLFQKEWGGFNDVVNANGGEMPDSIKLTYIFDHKELKRIVPKSPFKKNDIYYSIVIRPFGGNSYSLEEKLYVKNPDSPDNPYVYLDFKNERGILTVYHSSGIKAEKFAGVTSAQELILRQISDPRRYLPLHTIRTVVSQMALYESFDTNAHGIIRQPAVASSELRLESSGVNIASVLNNLKSEDIITFKKIQDKLRNINNSFEEFYFNNFGSRLYMSLIERKIRHSIGMKFISDGTLRYIIMTAILMNRHSGIFIGLDEPEGRLHPDMIHSIAEMMRFASANAQLLVATHSPLLLNDFELEDIIVFEKNKNNSTVVKKHSEKDFPEYGGDLLPGQLWLDGEIGGKRW